MSLYKQVACSLRICPFLTYDLCVAYNVQMSVTMVGSYNDIIIDHDALQIESRIPMYVGGEQV